MSDNGLRNRQLSIGSDRELDNLHLIRNLDTSQSDTEFRKKMDETGKDSNGRGPRTGHWASEFGTVTEMLETPGSSHYQGTEDTPVKKLKSKTVSIHPVEREYSDAYLESNLRTPRYNTHTSYEGMLENLDPEDPFDGEYTPSGKPKVDRPKKHRKDKSPDSKIPIPEQGMERTTKHRKSKKKKKRGHESLESTSTYTIDGNTNLTVKSSDIDKASVKSNGTYTVPVTESGTSTLSAPASSLKPQSSFRKSKRKSKRSGMRIDKMAFINFVRDNKIMQRKPKFNVHAKSKPGHKHIPHFHTDSTPEPCDSFGEIQFSGYGHDTENSPYVRVSPDTDPNLLFDLMVNVWGLTPPQLLISVTGGANRFDMKSRLSSRFKRGLMKAAISTGAWIITGGTSTGVMEFVGEAIRDHFITFGKRDNIVALGVATWGVVSGKEYLDGDDELKSGLFPAIYSKLNVERSVSRRVELDSNHTHFILVDDGTEGKFGGEITLRSKLEGLISQQMCDPVSGDCVNVPVVMIVVNGGINSMKTVWESIGNDVPVLVLDGSGRAADFIAEGYRQTGVGFLTDRQTEKSSFSKNFDQVMESYADEIFEWKASDTEKKPALINAAVKQLREVLHKRNMIHIYDLEGAKEEMDEAILLTLFKANKSSTNAQLSLALTWNRSDIAKNEIFRVANKEKLQQMKLDDAMVKSLIQNRTEFVKLFLEHATDMEQFLDVNNLWNIYANCLKDKSDRAAQLLYNHIMYLKQSWGEYFCCRPVTGDFDQPTDLLLQVGKVIVHLMGDEALNPYKETGWSKASDEKRSYVVSASQRPFFGYIEKTDDHERRRSIAFTKHRSKRKFTFKDPNRDLFIWAVMMNRKEIAMLFWKRGKDYICSALFASSLSKSLAAIADSDEDIELSNSFLENSKFYEQLACSLITECYVQNRHLAMSLLVKTVEQYGNTTHFTLADSNELMDFMGQTACQAKLNSIWKGRMALYTSTLKIIAGIFIPFLIPAIKFITSKAPGEELDKEDEEIIEEEYVMHGENKVTPETCRDMNLPETCRDITMINEKKEKKKGKFYKVQMFACGDNEETISIPYAIYYFYTAPVTKFWIYLISYLFFLGIFSLFVLTDLHSFKSAPISVYEYITWGWTITMVTEEVRQIGLFGGYVRIKDGIIMKEQLSLMYKLRSWWGSVWNKFDLCMYILFLTSVVLRFSLSEIDFVWARITYSITLSMYIMRSMQFFFVEKNIGPKVIMIRKMITDIQFFFMILAVFVLSFGVSYHANLFPNSEQSWSLLKNIVYLPYWQMYGELFLENIEGEEPSPCSSNYTEYSSGALPRCAETNAIVPLLLAVYMVLTNILLVNLLIAMFSDTFQKVQDNSEMVWKFYKFSLVYEYYDRPSLVPPFIILNHMFRIGRYIIVVLCKKFLYYNDFRTDLHKEEDIIRLHLFERAAVENYLYETQQEMSNDLNFQVSSTSERLEKVIDELDKIKDSVTRFGQYGGDGKPPLSSRNSYASQGSIRSTTMTEFSPRVSSTTAGSVGGPNVHDQVEKLAVYVHSEIEDMTKAMARMEKMMMDMQKKQYHSPTLDITHLPSADA